MGFDARGTTHQHVAAAIEADCNFQPRTRPIVPALSLEEGAIVVRLENPSGVGADVAVELNGQVRRAVLPTALRSTRVAGLSASEARFPLRELQLHAEDSAAQVSATTRAVYDDGPIDSHHADPLYIAASAGDWHEASPPALDPTVIVRSHIAGPAAGASVARVPETESELREWIGAQGIELSPDAVVINAIDAATPTVTSRTAISSLAGSLAVNFCFRIRTRYTDAGVGEDVWPESAFTYRGALGFFVELTPNVGQPFAAFLNTAGCTGSMSVDPATWTAKIYTTGRVQDRYVSVEPCQDGGGAPNDDCNGQSSVSSASFSIGSVTSSVTKVTDFAPLTSLDPWHITAVGLQGVYTNPGAPVLYKFKAYAPQSKHAGDWIWIKTWDGQRKWLVGHEMGHRFFTENAPLVPWGMINTYTVADTDADCDSGPNDHNIVSKEFSSSAFTEAIASFYGALTFNNVSAGADCWFQDTVDCEEGAGAYQSAWMENACPGQAGTGSPLMPGMGIEVDWLRALWNVRTGGSSTVSLSTMLQWLNVSNFSETNAYQTLDARANTVGGTLNGNWDSTKVTNGIDH